MTRLLPTLGLLLAALLLTGCSTNPATGSRSLTLLSWSEEKAMGAEAAPQFTAEFGGPVPDEQLQRYVTEVGQRLVAQVEPEVPSDLEWEFILLDSDVINAFALPGGKVFMTRGLASRFTDEAQLAGVLGHEIGHVTARHGNQRMSKQIGFNILIGAAAVGVGIADSDSDVRKYGQYAVPAMAVGGNVVLLKYGRDEESQADQLGVRYMARAGYNPIAQREVMEVLQAASGSNAGAPPEWLSTHPYPETRIERLNQILAEQYPDAATNPAYSRAQQRYQSQFLARLNTLPPAKHTGAMLTPAEEAMLAAGMLGSGCTCPGHIATR
ncbi:M48 family metallopeptidase [Nodularia spumigena]|uniref:M48 family metallopeptidase n=1 Tax=Nodularia spumigena TaxID=70799 RepID=UPI002B204376|nr:M48 family metallopeptidase [Nodularia spumigena]MEA5614569.1 M48 family metallopeptidase [Nodularia spumigena UHCC 0040]